MSNKTLASICAKHGFPDPVVDAMKKIPTVEVNELTGVIELWAGDEQVTAGAAGADGVTFVSGTTAPNNADGRPDGTVYVRYAV